MYFAIPLSPKKITIISNALTSDREIPAFSMASTKKRRLPIPSALAPESDTICSSGKNIDSPKPSSTPTAIDSPTAIKILCRKWR